MLISPENSGEAGSLYSKMIASPTTGAVENHHEVYGYN